MKHKLAVLDLDGTPTNSKKEITSRNRETLIRIQEQGIRLILASSRPTYGTMPLANKLRTNEFGGLILSYNGGEIINWETQEVVYGNMLPNEVTPVLYECVRIHQLSILAYGGAEIITENSQNPCVLKEAFLNKTTVRETDDFLTDITLPVAKYLIVGDADRPIPLEAELCLRLQDRVNVSRLEPYSLELIPQGISKALSLAVLLKEMGIAREEIIVMGGGYNDLSMIRSVGSGIAMGNTREPVKKAVDYIAPNDEEDGVVEAIRKFCNQQQPDICWCSVLNRLTLLKFEIHTEELKKKYTPYTESERMSCIHEYLSTSETKYQFAKRMGTYCRLLILWLDKYYINDKVTSIEQPSSRKDSGESLNELEKELAALCIESRKLQRALQEESLRYEACEELINFAESTYHVKIRKSSDAK